jgi:hypothetical protein
MAQVAESSYQNLKKQQSIASGRHQPPARSQHKNACSSTTAQQLLFPLDITVST